MTLPMKPLPAVELRLAPEEDRPKLRQMYAEQLRILNGFDESIEPGQELQSEWWQRPGQLFPYMIYFEGASVGFCLAMGGPYVAAVGEVGDFVLWEMFVGQEQRGQGVAEAALREILARHPGHWVVQAIPKNKRAMGFWRRVTLQPPHDGSEALDDKGFATFRFVAP